MKINNYYSNYSFKKYPYGLFQINRYIFLFIASLFFGCNKNDCEIGCGEIENQMTTAGFLATDADLQDEPDYTNLDSVEVDTVNNSLGKAIITEQRLKASQVRQLSKVLLSDGTTGIIFPGAVVQGGKFEEGKFVPVTIPKAGGKLTVSGLSGSSVVSEPVVSYEYGEVQNGIASLLNKVSGETRGTEANFFLTIEEVNSKSEMKFHMGLDVRYKLVDLESQVNITNQKEKSMVMLSFTQIFYSITIDQPETMFSLFRDGRNSADPEGQITLGNPPLYVSSVHYGRKIVFLVETEYSSEDVKVSLNGAYNGLIGSTKLESGFTYKEVLDKSNITYIVKGGSAGIALQEVTSYENVLKVISDGAEWSPENPGSPIAFDLRYLQNRELARMVFADEFTRKSSVLIPTPKGPECHSRCVTFRNTGGYVARVKVSYTDCNGKAASHQISNLTAGINKTWNIKTRDGSYRVEAWAKTGLVWAPWNRIFNLVRSKTDCYKLGGTTLNPNYNNSCKVCP